MAHNVSLRKGIRRGPPIPKFRIAISNLGDIAEIDAIYPREANVRGPMGLSNNYCRAIVTNPAAYIYYLVTVLKAMVSKLKKCPTCLGMGICDDGSTCLTCEGTGEIAHGKEVLAEPCWNITKDANP